MTTNAGDPVRPKGSVGLDIRLSLTALHRDSSYAHLTYRVRQYVMLYPSEMNMLHIQLRRVAGGRDAGHDERHRMQDKETAPDDAGRALNAGDVLISRARPRVRHAPSHSYRSIRIGGR